MSFDTDTSASTDSDDSPNIDDCIDAAQMGCPTAQFNIGIYFHSGVEIPRCYTRALHFFCLAARQGNADAMHMIGICYKYGEGVVVDNYLALQWFLFSSAKGNNISNYEIGYIYYHGYGVEKCYHTAEYHLRVGIQNGDTHGIPLYNETLRHLRGC